VSSTRERILGSARELVERGDGGPNMSELARAVGISRQALYLHFADRAALLVALVEHVDDREDLATGVAAFEAAPDAEAKIRTWVRMQASRNPRIAPFARALAQVRATDPAVALAWRNRMQNRMRGASAIVGQLVAEDRLHPSWTADEAAVLLWELTSFQVWDDLVNDASLAPDRYVEIVVAAALSTLASPVTGSA
jgi:AcrR family transcriptional regulator